MNGNDNGGCESFTGRFRGTVVTNIDPEQQGRLLVQVPDVMGSQPVFWAMPSSPIAGTQMGMYAVPPAGGGVWIEFEDGDPNYPIWTGSFRGSVAETPAAALAAPPTNPPVVIQSQAQNRIIVSSTPGEGLTLETAAGPTGPMIRIDATGITISDGQGGLITLNGGVVSINPPALVVK